jgi:hypothetical protein
VRVRLDASIDEITFRQRVDRTHVLDSKEPWRWDWPALYDVIDGPLALHINYALNKTKKFTRRVLAFFTPSASRDASLVVTPASVVAGGERRPRAPPGLLSVPAGQPFAFALLPIKPENVLYLRVICRLVEVLLLASEAGKTLLKQHKLLQEIATLVGHEAQCLRSGNAPTTRSTPTSASSSTTTTATTAATTAARRRPAACGSRCGVVGGAGPPALVAPARAHDVAPLLHHSRRRLVDAPRRSS